MNNSNVSKTLENVVVHHSSCKVVARPKDLRIYCQYQALTSLGVCIFICKIGNTDKRTYSLRLLRELNKCAQESSWNSA